MATFPRTTSKSSSLAGTRSSDDNSGFVRPPRTPYPDTSSDDYTLAQSITNRSISPRWYSESTYPTQSKSASSRSLPPSPLDNIPSRLHARFPRFSTITTEISNPDLSIEDVTSTRFSIDEEGIIAIPFSNDSNPQKTRQPGRLHRTIKKAISHQTMFLKKARVEIRRMPSHWGLVSKSRDKASHAQSSPPREPEEDLVSENAPVLPAIPKQSAELQLKAEAEENDPFVYRSIVREIAYRPKSKVVESKLRRPESDHRQLSALEEHRTSFESNQETPRPVTAITIKPKREPVTHFPPNTMRYKFPPPSFTPHASSTTVNSYHTALERPPLRRPSPLSRNSREMPRSLSSGSAIDSRFFPDRLGSSSNLSSRQNSMVSLTQTITPRPYSSYSRPVSARSDDSRAPPLQREALFVEISAQSKNDVNFVFPSKPEPIFSRVSFSSQAHSRATSVHSFYSNNNTDRPVIIRSASMVQGSHIDQTYRKVPLFVPARIEKHTVAAQDEHPRPNGRCDSLVGATDRADDDKDRSQTTTSELSNWSMAYQDGAVGRVSVDLESGSATIRPSKRGSLKDIMNHFSTKKPRHSNFAQGCGSCVRRLSRALRGKEGLTSSSTEKLQP